MTQTMSLQIKGLHTFANDLSEVPQGALVQADNIVIDRDSVAEPMRGFDYLRNISGARVGFGGPAKKIGFYQGRVIFSDSTYVASFDVTGGMTVLGTYYPPVGQTMRLNEANDNLYLTTLNGVYKMDSYLSTPTLCGVPPAVNINLWGTYGVGDIWVFTVASSAGQTIGATYTNNTVTFTLVSIPNSTTMLCRGDYFWTPSGGNLTYVTGGGSTVAFTAHAKQTANAQATNTAVSYRVVFGIYDANNNLVLGAPSNAVVVQNINGITYSNLLKITIPTGITASHICQIYRSDAVVSTIGSPQLPPDEQKQIDTIQCAIMLTYAVGNTYYYNDNVPAGFGGAILYTAASQQGIQNAYVPAPLALDICSFAGCQFYMNTTYRWTANIVLQKIFLDTSGLQVGDTITITQGANNRTYTAISWSSTPLPTQFCLLDTSIHTPAEALDATARSIVSAINADSGSGVSVWAYYDSGYTDLPGKIRLEAKALTGAQFTITSSRSTCWDNSLISTTGVVSFRDSFPNGVAYSLPQQPESVPAPNTLYPGSGDQPIYRGFALRDSLFILKSDGIYRIYGNEPSNFQLTLMDSTAKLIAPEAACVLSNQIYALTTQGIVTISETGVTIISRPIESDILQAITINPYIATLAFAFAYESQRAFYIGLPTLAGDTTCTQYYRYNLLTNAWTRGTLALSAGAVDPVANVIVAGAAAGQIVYVERKTLTALDYANYAFSTTITVSGGVLTPASGAHIVGEVVYKSATVWGIVTSISSAGKLTIASPVGTFTAGTVDILYPIQTAMAWAPQTLGSSVSTKQIREAQLIFRLDLYGSAAVGFASDLQPQTEYESVYGVNAGGWGIPAYGGTGENVNGGLWGGGSRRRTLRVGVTRNHQRCQLLTVSFSQAWAYSQWQLEGLTLIGTGISERTSWDGK